MTKRLSLAGFLSPLVILIPIICFNIPDAYADDGATQAAPRKKESLSTEELLKTKAGQLFVARQYDEALNEFQGLSAQYPDDLAIQRYIGACYFQMKRSQEAMDTFKKIIQNSPDDFSSHQFLAKLYLNNGDIENAEKEFNFIVENDKSRTFTVFAQSQLEAIKKLRESPAANASASGRQISPDQFLTTKAASFFAKAKYADALSELKKMESEYPQDILIKRYQGLALDKLGRFSEAMKVYRAALEIVPDSVAVHYFIAQTTFHLKDYEKTKTELQFVVDNDAFAKTNPAKPVGAR